MSELQAQIEDLQSRIAYQDHTLAQLNDVVAAQQRELEKLSRALRSLSQQFQDMREQGGEGGGGDERPPHY